MNVDSRDPRFLLPRRRKLVALGLIALTISTLLLFRELFAGPNNELLTPTSTLPVVALFDTTGTATAPVATKTLVNHQSVEPESVVFVLVIWSTSSAAEGALLIKSILLYNTRPSDIHIICDDDAEQFLRSRLALVTRPPRNVRVYFYKPSWQCMLDRVEREGSIQTDHSAGLPGLMKLFIHEIVPESVKKGIYVDTDALFIADPALLWNVFGQLKPATAIVMASHPDQDTPEWNHASRICSCVMLLNLEKLRSLRMMDSIHYPHDQTGDHPPAMSPPAFRAKYGLPGKDGHGRYDNVRLGDQGYWWAIVDYRPDIFEPLSYDFEVTSCLLDTYLTGLGDDSITQDEELSRQIHVKDTPQEGTVVLPKLLHFNCLHGTPVYMEWSGWSDPANSLTVRWGAAVTYHNGYKWIWLNQSKSPSSPTSLEMITVANVKFADELFANSS